MASEIEGPRCKCGGSSILSTVEGFPVMICRSCQRVAQIPEAWAEKHPERVNEVAEKE